MSISSAQYLPTWQSLDSRPLPSWYDEAKIGVFIHWGAMSVPSWGGEWFWWAWQGTQDQRYIDFMNENYKPGFTYQDFGPLFTAELWNPEQWAEMIADSGAKYVVFTTKHHDGYCNWPCNTKWGWNSQDVGPKRDIVGELTDAVRAQGIRMGLYATLFEWFNPLYLEDKANNWQTSRFVDTIVQPDLIDLVNTYQPEVIWSDGDWDAPDTYWKSKQFLAWLYNESPVKNTVVVNDRWGAGCMCAHGGYLTCTDNYNPGVLQSRKWENAFTIQQNAWCVPEDYSCAPHNSWVWNRNATLADWWNSKQIISQIVSTVACGGNVLVNIGPSLDGMILPINQYHLKVMGDWLSVNGQAIYGSKPWRAQNDTAASTWYTTRSGKVYAIFLAWPDDYTLELTEPKWSVNTAAVLLGWTGALNVKAASEGIIVTLPQIPPSKMPSQDGWTIELSNVS